MGNRIGIELDFEDSTRTKGEYLVSNAETTGLPIDGHAPPDNSKSWPHVVKIA